MSICKNTVYIIPKGISASVRGNSTNMMYLISKYKVEFLLAPFCTLSCVRVVRFITNSKNPFFSIY